MAVLSHLEPREVFRWFEEICGIPHGSGDTKKISDYLVHFAQEHGLKYRQDASNNVVIRKDAAPGYEGAPTVMLQGHIDMVCEKEPGCPVDMTREGVKLMVNDGVVTADGTTLGGDDGIAVAYALAILASDTIPHPPLEAVFTVDEEIGMLGAAALDMSDLKSRYMLNIDSEDEGYLLVGCAGGVTAVCHVPLERENAAPSTAAVLKICGCLGGHSGIEIDKGRANADQALGRVLYRLSKECGLKVISVQGGTKDNAIPAEAQAQIILAADDMDQAEALIEEINAEFKKEYAATDAGIHAELTRAEAAGQKDGAQNPAAEEAPMTAQSASRVITALRALPGGVQKMNPYIPGLVQTSLNLGIMEMADDEVRLSYSVRSSLGSEKQELLERMESLMEALGGCVTYSGDYPAWEYREESKLRDLMVEVFKDQYGKEPVVHTIHAGVECGMFSSAMPELDCVSFGPDMQDIHTPRESLDAASVLRTWNYLLEVLKRLK